MISHACPIVVLDDVRQELWEVAHGLGACGLPVMPHLVSDGKLERPPEQPHAGIRLLFTDLHLLGPTQSKPELYVSALINFIKQLISPSTYLIVFWSNFSDEANEAWNLLSARIPADLKPFGFDVLSKVDAKNAASDDPAVSEPATKKILDSVAAIIQKYPQLKAVMEWEARVSMSAAETTNDLVKTLKNAGVEFQNQNDVRAVMARMAQEVLGYPHAPKTPTKGLVNALLPIVQDWLERDATRGHLDAFLNISNATKIELPNTDLIPLLNDFFIHAEQGNLTVLDRGSVVRLMEAYLCDKDGLSRDVGLMEKVGNWKEAVCREFAHGWNETEGEQREQTMGALDAKNVCAVELSADCDHAQNKQRTQRFLFALFVPSNAQKPFYQKRQGERRGANDSIYVTPEITLENIRGRLLISCRIFLTKPYGISVEGEPITRLRKDVIDEISHQYVSHMRRPGKIAFY